MDAVIDLIIRVPSSTALLLSTVETGTVRVTGTSGDLDIRNVDGLVSLDDVSGAAVFEVTNGEIRAPFASVPAALPMSFSTWAGDIELTLRRATGVDLDLSTETAQIASDVSLRPSILQPEPGTVSFGASMEAASCTLWSASPGPFGSPSADRYLIRSRYSRFASS